MGSSGDVIGDELSAVAAAVSPRVSELSHEIWDVLIRDIPELRDDDGVQKLLDASVEENVTTLLHVFEHEFRAEDIRAPAAAVEYARRLAQRGVPIMALLRAYRIGHGRFLSRCLDQLAADVSDHDLVAAVTSRMIQISFGYIDQISEEVTAIYQSERDRWLLTQTAVRASRVREILRGASPVDGEAAERALGYRLRRYHLGVIAWVGKPVHGSEGLTRLDAFGASAARNLDSPGRPLFVPRDESMAWIWVPLGSGAALQPARLIDAFDAGDRDIRAAVGEPGHGLSGFRQTHLQARRTQDLALAAQPGTWLTTFADVGPIALLCADVPAARSWVWTTLAELAVDDEPRARLRTTLQVFLRSGTYTATAERLALHKNSVQYRIRKAEEALGAPIDDRHADVELALRACQYLGRAVLRPAGSRA